MQHTPFGTTGLTVSALGFGAGHVGDASLAEADVERLLNTALDLGIRLIDTARSYGLSEQRIGRHLAHRRSEFVLSTKLGYGIEGVPEWTGAAVSAGIDEALTTLRTEVIDIVHLHSCDVTTLQAGEVLQALDRARRAGKIRVAAYSGDNEALQWAVDSALVQGIECSVNVFDQAALSRAVPQARAAGLGVIAKRPLGNAPWRFEQRPVGHYAQTYWERMQVLGFDRGDLAWDELALRFAAFAPGVSSAIVGTSSVQHLAHNVALAERGPLPAAQFEALRDRFDEVGPGWRGEI